jgi:hypothetical protein
MNTDTAPSDVVAQLEGDQTLALSDDEYAKGYVLMVVTQDINGTASTHIYSRGLSFIERLGITVQAAEVAKWQSTDSDDLDGQ